MFYSCSDEELRAYCRNSIESLEMWARRLIHEKMVEKFGTQYINHQMPDGNYSIKKGIRNQVQLLSQKGPQRICRPVDALFLEDLIYFLCKQEWYNELFKGALDFNYPQGREEVRTFLERLIPIRNALSHANPISVRQAEKAICYSNDFIDSIKSYNKNRGLEEVWNVPRIVRVTDSFGNVFENPDDSDASYSIFVIQQPLCCGDTYAVKIEVDTSFPASDYDIIWKKTCDVVRDFSNCTQYVIKLTEEDVSELFLLECDIVSHKKWHRHKYYDSRIDLHLKVFPPIDN